jgi:DNA helicase-2/ATP-dependent DNA helicase PcrA
MPDIGSILDGLTPQQAAAATQMGAVLVLAGAGTGKTKTLTRAVAHRIAAHGIPASRILAVTFTNKAAAEMAARIRATLGDEAATHWTGTFHGLGARQLRIEPEVAGLRPGFDILDADDSRRIVKRVMLAMNLAAGDEGLVVGRDPLKVMCNRLSKFKDGLITPDEAPVRVEAMIAEARRGDTPVDPEGMRASVRVYAEYQRVLRDANAADFGDLLLWPTKAMLMNRAYRTRWAERFDCVLADEYQDVNQAQYTWIRVFAEQHGEIFVVGDDDQSVYSWRGSDLGYIRRFTRDFPNAVQIKLEENFRSTGHILEGANAIIAQDKARLGKTLFTRKPKGDRIEVIVFRDAEAEAAGIAAEMTRRHAEGTNWDEFAVLYRGNALSRNIEEALMRSRVPYVLVGDVAFYQRSEIKDALALLRLSTTPDDVQGDEAFRRVINVPPRGFGPKAMEDVQAEAAWRQVCLLAALETADLPPKARAAGLVFADVLRRAGKDPGLTVADRLSLLLDATGYRAMLRESRAETTEGRLDNIQELIQIAGGFHTARELLDHAALSTSGPREDATGRVRLMTLHKGKGLEFGHVFLPAWETGIFPPDYGDLSEERRLAYVALTRGMRRVTVSHAGISARLRGPLLLHRGYS